MWMIWDRFKKDTTMNAEVLATLQSQYVADREHEMVRMVFPSMPDLRIDSGLSQTDVAAKMRCTQSRIAKLESKPVKHWRLSEIVEYLAAIGYEVGLDAHKRKDTP